MRLHSFFVAGLLLVLFRHPLHVSAGGELPFLKLPPADVISVPRGDDTFSSAIEISQGFRFGNGTVYSVYVSTNGYISMGLTPTANAQNVQGANSVVAPYGADIDTNVAGSVNYTNFYSKTEDLEVVSRFIALQMQVVFSGREMMMAKWDRVAQYNGNRMVTSTFQAVLISDGAASYAVFIYECGGMGWGGAEIGWQSSKTDADEHKVSGAKSADIGCRYSMSHSAIVFRLESCNKDQFRCDGGRCMNRGKLCDGNKDCLDHSDEEQDCLDITLIISGAVFGFVIACFIIVAIFIFLYCLIRNKNRKRGTTRSHRRPRDRVAIDLEATPTSSDTTEQISLEPSSSSVRETGFTNGSLYPKLPNGTAEKKEENELDLKEKPFAATPSGDQDLTSSSTAAAEKDLPPPSYNDLSTTSNNVYQGYPAPTYPSEEDQCSDPQITEL